MFKYYYFETLASTNETAQTYPPDCVIHAAQQTKGKGRMGRTWTGLDNNLFMSVVLPRPQIPSDYSFIAALAVAKAIAPLPAQIKWPNDILVGGKKIAGILLETTSDTLIIGIGVNIAASPNDTLYPTTSLKELRIDTTSKDLLDKILQNLQDVITLYQKTGFQDIRRQWLAFAAGIGQQIRICLPNKELTGIFNGLTEQGALILKAPETQYIITAGDVFMI